MPGGARTGTGKLIALPIEGELLTAAIRRVLMRRHGSPAPPFRIYYQRTPEAFLVVRIDHQRREPVTR